MYLFFNFIYVNLINEHKFTSIEIFIDFKASSIIESKRRDELVRISN